VGCMVQHALAIDDVELARRKWMLQAVSLDEMQARLVSGDLAQAEKRVRQIKGDHLGPKRECDAGITPHSAPDVQRQLAFPFGSRYLRLFKKHSMVFLERPGI